MFEELDEIGSVHIDWLKTIYSIKYSWNVTKEGAKLTLY